jgi:hypothetical protein
VKKVRYLEAALLGVYGLPHGVGAVRCYYVALDISRRIAVMSWWLGG